MIEWFQYPSAFFAGAFLSNAVPHFVQGISGNKFPTPFSKPRGVGLSSSATNMIWALANIVAGYLLFCTASPDNQHKLLAAVFFVGIASAGVGLSIRFKNKHKE